MISGSFRIGRLAGIDVYVHWTFFLLLIYRAMNDAGGGQQAIVFSLLLTLALFGCVTLHELGHALMARRFGIATRDITLLPIGGVARLQRMPDRPVHELLVALAGPAVNVVIAAVLYFWVAALPEWNEPFGSEDFLSTLLLINVGLVLFNMLPAFPMDGGRVVRSVLAMVMSRGLATRIAAFIGQGMAVLFGALGVWFWHPILVLIAVFVFIGARAEARAVQQADRLQAELQLLASGRKLNHPSETAP